MNINHLDDVLSVYFSRLFPFDELFEWLSYGENAFENREFAFNFQGERFLRHQAYNNINDLKHEIKKLHPVKMDIGAIYNTSPLNYMREAKFYPIQKELIFDIDLTDYDDVRTCCSGVNVCIKCWKYMTIAVQILDVALREDFGFEHILWTFSGRRGIHCWVCDKRARLLKKCGRYAAASYLQVVTGGEYKKKKVEIDDKIHHSVKRAVEIIEPLFVPMCIEEQDILGTEQRVLKFLGIISEDEMRTEVKEILDQYPTSLTKWQAFIDFFRNQIQLGSEKWCETPFLIEEIMIQYAYPRLDINVTLGMTHLLKSPFCVHPKTGKIGVPLDPKTVKQFDPNNVPTILQLMEEIDVFDAKAREQGMSVQELRKVKDINKTSLYKFLQIFHKFLYGIQSTRKDTMQESDTNKI